MRWHFSIGVVKADDARYLLPLASGEQTLSLIENFNSLKLLFIEYTVFSVNYE